MPIPSTPLSTPATSTPVVTPRVALAVATTLFFMWGFLTSLNDVLIPHLKAVFELNYTRAMLVQFAFYGAYFLMSLPAGRLVGRATDRQSTREHPPWLTPLPFCIAATPLTRPSS